jgi:acetoin utilization deacetylase AcuC-like enzyme
MITREHLQSAIHAIHAVNPDAGLGLKGLFAASRITVPTARGAPEDAGQRSFTFYFDGQRVDIPKTAFVAHGIPTLEQSLVFKFGELREKQARAAGWISGNVRQLVGAIRQAGAAALVDHELRRLSRAPSELDTPLQLPAPHTGGPHFRGHLAGGQAARFTRLPLNRDILAQIAGQRFEFFDVRSILQSWSDGTLPWIYACITRGQLLGMVWLKRHRQLGAPRLEIRYIARRMPEHDDTETPPRGVGTFLVAGVWMVWQTLYPEARHVFLDGEIGARRFYRGCGFIEERLCRYVLKTPHGYLLTAIADMADEVRPPATAVRRRLEGFIKRAVKTLNNRRHERERRCALAFIRRCLMARHQPYPATTALSLLLKYRHRIPEAPALIDYANRTCRVRIAGEPCDQRAAILVVDDPRFGLHLKDVFHLESPRRFEAFQRALAHPSLDGRWQSLPIAPAERRQLEWVHTTAYLDRLEQTAGRRLATLDMDTQTSAQSWEVACLAVGGVFRLVEAIWGGRAMRGIAAIRPPGHHAEPDRAMGFCLLNNVALAARFLQNVHGVGRIMIVDLDAHHGNGTQTIFYEDDAVLYVSAHGFPAYPGTGNFGEIGQGRGRGFTVNIPLSRGAGNREYTGITRRIIGPLARQFKPDIILVSLGFDLYQHDRLGGMQVTPEGYGTLTAMLIQIAERECGGRIAFILEGGYSVKGIEVCGLRFLQQLCASPPENRETSDRWRQNAAFTPSAVSKVIEVQRPFWPGLV